MPSNLCARVLETFESRTYFNYPSFLLKIILHIKETKGEVRKIWIISPSNFPTIILLSRYECKERLKEILDNLFKYNFINQRKVNSKRDT